MTCKIRPATPEEVLANKPEWALLAFNTGHGTISSIDRYVWIVAEGEIAAHKGTLKVGDFVGAISTNSSYPLVSGRLILTDDSEVVVGDGTMRALGFVIL